MLLSFLKGKPDTNKYTNDRLENKLQANEAVTWQI